MNELAYISIILFLVCHCGVLSIEKKDCNPNPYIIKLKIKTLTESIVFINLFILHRTYCIAHICTLFTKIILFCHQIYFFLYFLYMFPIHCTNNYIFILYCNYFYCIFILFLFYLHFYSTSDDRDSRKTCHYMSYCARLRI